MMNAKTPYWIITSVAVLALALVGCGKKGVDTSKLEKSFASAQADAKGAVDSAVSSIKAGDHASAMASLQRAAAQAQLTPQQEAALKDVIAQVQEQLQQAVKKAAGDAQKAIGDFQKSLPK